MSDNEGMKRGIHYHSLARQHQSVIANTSYVLELDQLVLHYLLYSHSKLENFVNLLTSYWIFIYNYVRKELGIWLPIVDHRVSKIKVVLPTKELLTYIEWLLIACDYNLTNAYILNHFD